MKLLRSMLFVPGNKAEWIEKAPKYKADSLVIDLEDAVPENLKEEGRKITAELLPLLKERGQLLYVRINGLDTGHAGKDLEAIVCGDLDGIMVPKLEEPKDIIALDALLKHFEIKNGLALGHVEIIALIETAKAMKMTYELCITSSRVVSVLGGATKGGDINRALGYEWTKEGKETLYMRSRILLDARAAGILYPLAGVWSDIEDLEGLRQDSIFSKQLGYRGYVVIHPSHVPIVNEVFSISKEQIEFSQGLIKALEEAEKSGTSAARYKGDFIDIASVKTARELLDRAEEFGLLRPKG